MAGLRAALGEAGVAVEAPGDIWTELWAKFLFVVPLGGLGGVSGQPVGVLRSRPGMCRLLVEAITEIRELARARGWRWRATSWTRRWALLTASRPRPRRRCNVMWRRGDRRRSTPGRGAVVRLASAAGVAVPGHGVLHELLGLRAERPAESRGGR